MLRKPLKVKDLFTLKPGDKFVVFWAKDDDPRDVRLNYRVQTIASIKEGTISVTDLGYEWRVDQVLTPEENALRTGRGYAYFYVHELST